MNTNNKFTRQYKLGFTLIELIITFSIIAMLFITMVPVLHSYQEKNKLRVTAQQYEGMLIEGRNYALAPRAIDTDPVAYGVRLVEDKSTKNITELISYARDKNDSLKTISQVKITKGLGLQANVDINHPGMCPFSKKESDGSSNYYNVEFKVPHGEVVFNGHYIEEINQLTGLTERKYIYNDRSNRNNNAPADKYCYDNGGISWSPDPSGAGSVVFKRINENCEKKGIMCQQMIINTGQVSRKEITGNVP